MASACILANVLKNVAQGLRRCRAPLQEGDRARPEERENRRNNLANVLNYVRKDYDGAEKMYRKAIALDPNAWAHNACNVLKDVKFSKTKAIDIPEVRQALELEQPTRRSRRTHPRLERRQGPTAARTAADYGPNYNKD